MGQKTHPLGFRLGITQDHKSKWYANFHQYANILKEDDKIRTYIETIAKTNSISNVQINRNSLNDQIQLNIEITNESKKYSSESVGKRESMASKKRCQNRT